MLATAPDVVSHLQHRPAVPKGQSGFSNPRAELWTERTRRPVTGAPHYRGEDIVTGMYLRFSSESGFGIFGGPAYRVVYGGGLGSELDAIAR
jgi:hypothetical protein